MTTYPLQKQTAVLHSTEKPPVWGELEKRFMPEWKRTAVAYGNTIHAAQLPLPVDVEVHERTHLHQHGYTNDGAAKWWDRYLKDADFRYEQELEAYRDQYRFLCKTVKDRNDLARRTMKLARDLATMYELEINVAQALAAIKRK